jgi:hypothetical protein
VALVAVGSCASLSRQLYGGSARKLPDCSEAHGQLVLVGRRASGSWQLSAHACGKLRLSTVEHDGCGGWRGARVGTVCIGYKEQVGSCVCELRVNSETHGANLV